MIIDRRKNQRNIYFQIDIKKKKLVNYEDINFFKFQNGKRMKNKGKFPVSPCWQVIGVRSRWLRRLGRG